MSSIFHDSFMRIGLHLMGIGAMIEDEDDADEAEEEEDADEAVDGGDESLASDFLARSRGNWWKLILALVVVAGADEGGDGMVIPCC